MKFETFAMERLQSTWENRVAWNLSESGVHPLRVEEIAETDEERHSVLAQSLGYPQTNGTVALRHAIAQMYPGATTDHVQVTNGGSEANCIALWHLIEPGDEVVMMTPNYMQVRGLSRALGARVVPWPLACDSISSPRWKPDLDLLAQLVTDRTRMILICNPNNPTGARLTAEEVEAICRIADRHGVWVLSDEIYRGAEMDGVDTPTVWGRYERAIVTSGLSKAYGLPGLRIGWVVSTPELVEALWSVHDYTTIAPGAVNDCLAQIALAPARRERLLARTRGILLTNYPLLRKWIERRSDRLFHVPPDAGAIAFVRYAHAVNSTHLIERLRDEKGVLVVPGDHFEMDGYLRIGFGADPTHLTGSLNQIGELLDTLPGAFSDAR
jgi:aspartate/methionine/tyrosine aminotransferase